MIGQLRKVQDGLVYGIGSVFKSRPCDVTALKTSAALPDVYNPVRREKST